MPSNFLEFVYADSQLGSHFQQQDWRNSFILEHEDLKRANLHNGASGTPPAVGTAAVLMHRGSLLLAPRPPAGIDELSKRHQALLGSHWLPAKLNARACVSRGLEAAMGDLVPGFGAAPNWKFKGLLSNPALVSPPVANSPPPCPMTAALPTAMSSRYKLLERKPTKNDPGGQRWLPIEVAAQVTGTCRNTCTHGYPLHAPRAWQGTATPWVEALHHTFTSLRSLTCIHKFPILQQHLLADGISTFPQRLSPPPQVLPTKSIPSIPRQPNPPFASAIARSLPRLCVSPVASRLCPALTPLASADTLIARRSLGAALLPSPILPAASQWARKAQHLVAILQQKSRFSNLPPSLASHNLLL
ncbi:uncharacterized protein TrAFT101_010560 [Trichoderma asperellum]|uniref:uncharacterized protein n=1 Tax=Trichoderma asperellum TaxID=101201 RepID=UPI0033344626|nr:hypothetical protein TrAFT101_010560 [Trichoderma asperellum]